MTILLRPSTGTEYRNTFNSQHWQGFFDYFAYQMQNGQINPFKPSGAKWLHYKVFKAILV